MKRKHFLTLLTCLPVGFLVATGCSQTPTTTPSGTSTAPAETIELTVSAAASMQDAMKAIKPVYQEENPQVRITYNFGSSGSLKQQIEQGAPADVFLSASPKWIDALDKENLLLEGTRQDLLKNTMVLIIPANSEQSISNFPELSDSKVQKVALGDPESVPAGQYAKEVLTSLNLYQSLASKYVFGKDVRQVLSYVETGNVDAGLVYGTDAKISGDKVKIASVAPENTHKAIIYPVAVIKDTKHPEAAQEFIKFMSSDQAKEVFEQYGFSMAE
ncbi:MAG: molybdate ABC transporter substrate-binding protein [Coleofasciculaceae cyanobacterium]